MGFIYLLHFEEKLSNRAQHYLGYTDNLDTRLKRHKSGNGASIMKAVAQNNIRQISLDNK